MESTLSKIQKIYKILKILTKILFIISVVGVMLCVIAIMGITFGIDKSFELAGVTFNSIVSNEAGLTTNEVIYSLATSNVICVCTSVLMFFVQKHAENVLSAGSPFTHGSAREVKYLGIMFIVISICTEAVLSLVYKLAGVGEEIVNSVTYDAKTNIIIGAIMLFISLVFKYVAELEQKKTENNQN